MKKSIQIIAISIVCFIIIDRIADENAYSNIAGAVAKVTGSPFSSEKTCSQTDCHSGEVTALPGIITSNIPPAGYVPGNTYTVTISVSDPSITRFGFEISPQNATGVLAGTMVITDAARTHFSTFPTDKYLTHTLAGVDAPDHSTSWSFDWVAPSVGTGDVTFYSCVNFTNHDSTKNGDAIHSSTLTVPENPNGINDPVIVSSLSLYPNPAIDLIQLDYFLQSQETVTIDLMDVTGKVVSELFNASQFAGAHHSSFPINSNVAPGVYLVKLTAGDQSFSKKVLVL